MSTADPAVDQDVLRRPSFESVPFLERCRVIFYTNSLSATAIMASVLVVVPAVRGRPAFIPAVLHVLSDREADADVENHYRLNDVEQNNVA